MGEDQFEAQRAIYMAADEIQRIFGVVTALDEIDAVTAMGIIQYIQARPGRTWELPNAKAERVALVSIAALAEHDPGVARSMIAELNS